MIRSLLSGFAPCVALVLSTDAAICEEPLRDIMDARDSETRYIRVERNSKDQATQLQTSIVRYQSRAGDTGLTVDLIGAVHIAEAGYYEKLNRQFQNYDVVLYELVAPKGTRPSADSRGQNPVSTVQDMARSLLNLESQLDHIDYSATNFVHADMSPQDIVEKMETRGDNAITVALDVVSNLIRETNKQQNILEQSRTPAVEQIDPFAMLFAADRDVQLKRMMAEHFASMESLNTGFGPAVDRMLISDRNEVAMRTLQQEIAQGRKKIAIFFGAAHMPDFARRLRQDFGLRETKTKWLTAWDLTSERNTATGSVRELLKMLE